MALPDLDYLRAGSRLDELPFAERAALAAVVPYAAAAAADVEFVVECVPEEGPVGHLGLPA